MLKSAIYNPYGNPDGTPKYGQEEKFFEYARKEYLKKLAKMPPEEHRQQMIADDRLCRRMAELPPKRYRDQ